MIRLNVGRLAALFVATYLLDLEDGFTEAVLSNNEGAPVGDFAEESPGVV
ncbi:MAG TPA: hypothetical protein VE086_08390 [Chthoniobacterales bacterium]|nr:hypothetical protein [Chthoniobacterales bacterium]